VLALAFRSILSSFSHALCHSLPGSFCAPSLLALLHCSLPCCWTCCSKSMRHSAFKLVRLFLASSFHVPDCAVFVFFLFLSKPRQDAGLSEICFFPSSSLLSPFLSLFLSPPNFKKYRQENYCSRDEDVKRRVMSLEYVLLSVRTACDVCVLRRCFFDHLLPHFFKCSFEHRLLYHHKYKK
jgi:hypothetical protein